MCNSAVSWSLPLLYATLVSAITFDCSHIRVDNIDFDLSKLGGPHAVYTQDKTGPAIKNTTWTIDICSSLKKINGIDDKEQCPIGTNICGVKKSWNPIENENENWIIQDVIPVAGTLANSGTTTEPKYTRLKAIDSQAEGLQVELGGGTYGEKKQKAVVVFVCDKSRNGNEGTLIEASASKFRSKTDVEIQEQDEDKSGDGANNPNSLTYVSYGQVEGKEAIEVLRLNWRTKYACEDAADDDGGKDGRRNGRGFFTWFILIAFLGIAAYLIFGSWLNYNRYGARGWDLLPHGDTIRDVPYLFKDWSRKVVDTVSGGGTRGGYSAV